MTLIQSLRDLKAIDGDTEDDEPGVRPALKTLWATSSPFVAILEVANRVLIQKIQNVFLPYHNLRRPLARASIANSPQLTTGNKTQ